MTEHPEVLPPDPLLPAGSHPTLLECPFCRHVITGIADSDASPLPPQAGNIMMADCCGRIALLAVGPARQGLVLRVPYPAEVGRILHSGPLRAELHRRATLGGPADHG